MAVMKKRSGVSPMAVVDPRARLGRDVAVEPFALVGRAAVGTGSLVRSHTVIASGARIGRDFKSGPGAQVRERTVLGNRVVVGSHCVVLPGARIADGVTLHSFVLVGEHSRIGRGTWIGPGAVLLNTLHPKAPRCRNKALVDKKGGPVIGNDVRIGGNAVINPFVTVGRGAVVGAGAVVTRDVPPGTVVAGSPARVLKRTRDVVCPVHPGERVYASR